MSYSGPYDFIEDEELRQLEEDSDILLVYDDDGRGKLPPCSKDGLYEAVRAADALHEVASDLFSVEEFSRVYDEYVYIASLDMYSLCIDARCGSGKYMSKLRSVADSLEMKGFKETADKLRRAIELVEFACGFWRNCRKDKVKRWCWLEITVR